jgi:hypothetical protein
MIDDLDKALRTLLKLEIPEDLDEEHIRFEAPDAGFAPSMKAINLFLYDVRENRELRSAEWLMERQNNGAVTKQRAPVRVDCSYLITAWAGDVLSEHLLLGKVMRALLRHPTLPAEVLPDTWRGPSIPLPTSVLQPGLLQSLGEFWQALGGGRMKAALHYTVTIAVEVYPAVEAGKPVMVKRIPGRKEEA